MTENEERKFLYLKCNSLVASCLLFPFSLIIQHIFMIHGLNWAELKLELGQNRHVVQMMVFFSSNSSEEQWGEFEKHDLYNHSDLGFNWGPPISYKLMSLLQFLFCQMGISSPLQLLWRLKIRVKGLAHERQWLILFPGVIPARVWRYKPVSLVGICVGCFYI